MENPGKSFREGLLEHTVDKISDALKTIGNSTINFKPEELKEVVKRRINPDDIRLVKELLEKLI